MERKRMELHLKYRPQTLEQIFGQKAVIRSLQGLKDIPHTFLFHGPSGVGKTTIARILGGMIEGNIVEIDAATNTGVDDVRELLKTLPYQGFGSGKKMIILDECHKLSNSAWNALLKVLEEPPAHVYFCLCTTELKKVPNTIRTRSHMYELNPLSDEEMGELLEYVADKEVVGDCEIFKNEDMFYALIEASKGSARQALVFVSACAGLTDGKDISDILQSVTESNKEVIDFCRDLVKEAYTYKSVLNFLNTVKKEKLSPEGVRIQIAGYLTACLLNAKSTKSMLALASSLDIFSEPIYNTQTGYQDLVLMIMNIFE